MKRKIYSILASLSLIITLVGCNKGSGKSSDASGSTGSSSTSEEDDFGPDEVAEELVLPTNVTDFTLDETDYDSLAEQATNTIRVFYHRNDNTDTYSNYKYWRIWAWDMDGGNGWWYEFTKYNAFGVICEIPVADVAANGTSIQNLGMVITTCSSQTATWTGTYSKDPDSDLHAEVNASNPGGIQRIYVKTGTASVYYTQESVFMSTMEYARYNDMKTIRAVFVTGNKDFAFYKKRFTITKNGEAVTNFSLTDIKMTKSGGGYQAAVSIVFEQPFEMSDIVIVKYRISADYSPEQNVLLTAIYDSEEFINKYSYTGSDLGATLDNEANPTKTTFKVWSPVARSMKLNVYATSDYRTDTTPTETVDLTMGEKGVWSAVINKDLSNKYYTYTVSNSAGTHEVVDPYAKSAGLNGRRGMVVNFTQLNNEVPGWAADERFNYGDPTDASIYEIHIRDMTINANSGVDEVNRGRYLGLAQTGTTYTKDGKTVKTGLDHLEELGITHVQIQPTYDYSSVDETNVSSSMSETNYNWGYDPQNYNALEGSYSSNPLDGANRIKEFKTMVMALHNKGINTIMDVVYNHTSSFSDSNFEQLVPLFYHRTKSSGVAYNGSGCGNEMATDRYMVNKFVRESCKFFTDEYHLSGFRFDLMGLIDNQTMIDVYNDCHAIDNKILVYGEPWTGGTTKLKNGTNPNALTNQQTVQGSLAQSYFVGSNVLVGAFSDGMRNAARGGNGPDAGYVQGVAGNANSLLPGIKGLFNASQTNVEPEQVINYVSCHDNYTLYDQLVQTIKGSRNLSMAYNQAETLVFTSQGVPFMQEGEDFMRTKAYTVDGATKYSGNSYNVGDLINNMDYELKLDNIDTFNYFKSLIEFRKTHDVFSLSTRSEINSKLKNVKASNGVISYELDAYEGTYLVIHTCNSTTVDLDASYELMFTNTDLEVGVHFESVTLPQNGSVILLK